MTTAFAEVNKTVVMFAAATKKLVFVNGYKRKKPRTDKLRRDFPLAEWVGFEPTVPEGTTDFESVPL